jgi:hypothetical protein
MLSHEDAVRERKRDWRYRFHYYRLWPRYFLLGYVMRFANWLAQ